MDKQQARQIIRDTFEKSFDKKRFAGFIKNLLNRIEDAPFTYQGNYIPDAYKQHIKTLERIGKFSDGENSFDILVITLQKETSLERARTMQRNFIAWYLNGSRGGVLKDAALAAFVSPDAADWRFSLVKMDYKFEKNKTGRMKVKEEFTPARRWSFLVGVNEKSHTAQSRLVDILANDEQAPSLEEIEKAFDIETVTKEFFLKYRELFLRTKEELDRVIKNDPKIKADFEAKGVDTVNFAKKLLGQIVFLYFLQKKGWFGVGRDDDWGTGSKHFLRELFDEKHSDYNNFYNDILEPLFYEALRIDRSHDDGYYSQFNCKIPFLNGGLFDPIGGNGGYDWVHIDIIIPDQLFSNTTKTKEGDTGDGILDIFDRFNFTVKEDEPLEKEVAIDPELLGKAYEKFNAIRPDNYDEFKKALKSGKKGEENKFNKKFGVYYTPREIVHYMCQQSLISYLATELSSVIPSEARNLKEDLETLIHIGEQVSEREETALIKEQNIKEGKQKTSGYKLQLSKSIRSNAALIDQKLAEVTVCDPAVGSGAFPVGMMSEIVKTRNVLSVLLKDNSRNAYDFKRRCIEHSLYGVDIDPGAVEIAKLRLWLSLVVDEEDIKNIKPLPNLDYKIVCGNSLLGVEKNLFNHRLFNELEELKPLYFNETNPTKKQEYKKQIDKLISDITSGHTEFDFKVYFSEVFHEKGGFDVVVANPPYVDSEIMVKETPKLRKLYTRIFQSAKGNWDLFIIFIEKGINLLRQNGVISYIVPNKLIGAKYSEALRNILIGKNVKEIRDYSKVNVFKEASVYPVTFVILNNSIKNDVFMTLMESVVNIENCNKIPKASFYKDINWARYFVKNELAFNILIKLTKYESLVSFFPDISGAATVNEAYEIKKLIKEANRSLTKYKKFINTGTIDPYVSLWGIKKTTYIKSSYQKPIISDSDLRHFRTNRFSQACSEKIIIGGMTKKLECFYDDGEYLAGKSTTIILPGRKDLKFLIAILNSKLISFWYRTFFKSLSLAGGFIRIGNSEIKKIPLIDLNNSQQTPFIKLVNCILTTTKDYDYLQNTQKQAKVKALETEIDQLVYKLYGLTPEEIKIVEGES